MLAGETYVYDEPPAADSGRCRELLHGINAAGPDDDLTTWSATPARIVRSLAESARDDSA